jgi:hypothetical protein
VNERERPKDSEGLGLGSSDMITFINRDAFLVQAQRLCELLKLPEWRKSDIQAIQPLGGGNDGQIFELFKGDKKTCAEALQGRHLAPADLFP